MIIIKYNLAANTAYEIRWSVVDGLYKKLVSNLTNIIEFF
jgi:hypothetical protein